jgi:hypothetical protein
VTGAASVVAAAAPAPPSGESTGVEDSEMQDPDSHVAGASALSLILTG